MQNKVISKQREKIIPFAKGRVLEIGIGSGLNFSFYNKSDVKDVFAVEPDNVLLEKAKKRALEESRKAINLIHKFKQESENLVSLAKYTVNRTK